MPISSIERIFDTGDPPAEIGIRVHGIGQDGLIEILYEDIPGSSWNAARLQSFLDRFGELIDIRIPLVDLPVDWPDRVTDPARLDYFHDAGDLVSHPIEISDPIFTDRLSWTTTKVQSIPA